VDLSRVLIVGFDTILSVGWRPRLLLGRPSGAITRDDHVPELTKHLFFSPCTRAFRARKVRIVGFVMIPV
jgi:hypothetical protein